MIAVIVYHKNIFNLYPVEWIQLFKESIQRQTRRDFVIYELNYGGGEERIFTESEFESYTLPTFVHAMNVLYDKAFANGAEMAMNVNCDDFYSFDRIRKQAVWISKGYDIVASNFCLVRDDVIVETHKFHTMDIERELNKGHNIIGHPVVAMSKKFWETNRYEPEDIPTEDLQLWQRSISTHKFLILPDILLFHRLHGNSVCQSSNR